MAINHDGDLIFKKYGEAVDNKFKKLIASQMNARDGLAMNKAVNKMEHADSRRAMKLSGAGEEVTRKYFRSYALILKKLGDYDLAMLSTNFFHWRGADFPPRHALHAMEG